MAPEIITINGNLVEHAAQKEGGTHFAPDASETNYLIMQCFAPLDESQRELLKELGVDVQQFISGDTYFCRYDAHDLTPLRSLPFVHFVNPYHPHYVAGTSLKARVLNSSNDARHEVHVTPHNDHKSPEALDALAEKIAHRLNMDASDIVPQIGYFRILIRPQDVDLLAGLDEIRFISETGESVPFNWTARGDINVLEPSPSYAGFASHNDFLCAGEIVAVGDSGIDINHPAFAVDGPDGPSSRIIGALSWRTNGTIPVTKNTYNVVVDGEYVADTNAHGTHVAGSVGGNWFSPALQAPICGTAPKADLVCQVLFEEDGTSVKFPKGQAFQTVVANARKWGAKTHTNSYGAILYHPNNDPYQNPYPSQAVDVDNAAWDNRDTTILFAAGNLGTRGVIIGSQASAKNCITVGACEASHPLLYDATIPSGQAKYRYQVGSPRGKPDRIAAFSSQGPTQNTMGSGSSNSRIKPEVMAPGVNIYSARSETATSVGARREPFNHHGIAPDNEFFFQCGTSMATPLVAGACTVIRKALTTCVKQAALSSAMVKAVLINGTTDMTAAGVPQQDIVMHGTTAAHQMALAPAPSPQQGFGRVNLAKSLLCVPNYPKACGGVFPLRDIKCAVLRAKTSADVPITIPNAPDVTGTSLGPLLPRLTVTMCYTDAPSAEGSGSLVNKLVLGVTCDQVAADGTETKVVQLGNRAPGDTNPDTANNVQKVIWPNFPAQTATAIVKCLSIGQGLTSDDPAIAGGQDFAVAWCVEWDDLSNNSVYKYYNNITTSANAVLYATRH